MPNWLSFLTSQGRTAVEPMWAFTVDAFLVRKTQSEAGSVSSFPNVIWLLTWSFCFSWMAWLGDHSWRRCREWWWFLWSFLWWKWWCLLLFPCCTSPSEPSAKIERPNRKDFLFNFSTEICIQSLMLQQFIALFPTRKNPTKCFSVRSLNSLLGSM